MNIGWLLFGFQGRINRAKFWLTIPLTFIGLSFLLWIVGGALLARGADVPVTASPTYAVVISALFFTVFAASIAAVGVKRLHDRDKSGWWLVLFYFAPAALDRPGPYSGMEEVFEAASFGLSLWALVELGFLRGTGGPNRYGPDPLAA